jgi:hypothetical protein
VTWYQVTPSRNGRVEELLVDMRDSVRHGKVSRLDLCR